MALNAFLPVLVPGIIILLIASVAAALALTWVKDAQAQIFIRRAWVGVSVLVVVSVAVFWISSAMVRPHVGAVDRSLQEQQQNDLQNRANTGGH